MTATLGCELVCADSNQVCTGMRGGAKMALRLAMVMVVVRESFLP